MEELTWPTGVKKFVLNGKAVYQLTCPDCKSIGTIDEDQLHGRVSVLCSCGYHETKDWSKELK